MRAAADPSVGGNNRRSSSASSISSRIGQLRPAAAARRTYSPTAVLPIPVASPTSRRLIPIACVRRSTSRIFLIDIRSAGIGHSLVARETDQLIRLSTGARSTPPSPAVRNHRIAVRLAVESVSALNRIPHPFAGDRRSGEPILRRHLRVWPLPIVQEDRPHRRDLYSNAPDATRSVACCDSGSSSGLHHLESIPR